MVICILTYLTSINYCEFKLSRFRELSVNLLGLDKINQMIRKNKKPVKLKKLFHLRENICP